MSTTATQFSSRMNESDATLWSIERDPSLRTTIVAIALLDRSPSWSRLRDRLSGAVEQVPRLRQRVAEGPLPLGPPHWVPDAGFDLDYHLRRAVAPAPGDLRAVLDLAGPLYMTPFDRQRPLWEFTLVEGMEGGRAALVQKVHHSFTDGVGGMKLAELVLDRHRGDRPRATSTSAAPGEAAHGPAGPMAVQAAAEEARHAMTAGLRLARAATGLAADATLHPADVARQGMRTLTSVGKMVAPARQPLSPVMTGRGLSRRLEAFELPLADLLGAAHAVDASLNDAFLAGVTGGLRRYHERHHRPVDRLRVTMPISVRRDGDGDGNNRFAPARFSVPISIVDPVARMHYLGGLARTWRKEPAVPLASVIAGVLNRMPGPMTTAVLGSMLKAIDFVATNVPGPSGPRYLAGGRLLREYAFAPPSGSAFAIALLSVDGSCCFGLTVDTAAVPDAEVLTTCIQEGFGEVLTAGSRS